MKRVVLLEPEPAVRGVVADTLAREGFDVVAARDERTMLSLLDERVSVVVCEDEAAAVVRERSPELPIVSLEKPFSASELLEAVWSALGRGRISVLVVEDHPAVRASLAAYFAAQDDVDVVGEAANGWEAYQLVGETSPDFVLMDIRMPVMDGIEGTRMIKGRRPETRVVLLSAYEQDELIEAGLEAGADGFVLKGAPGRELMAIVRERR